MSVTLLKRSGTDGVLPTLFVRGQRPLTRCHVASAKQVQLTVVCMDGSCFTVSPEAIEESEPDAPSTEVA